MRDYCVILDYYANGGKLVGDENGNHFYVHPPGGYGGKIIVNGSLKGMDDYFNAKEKEWKYE